jgi:hypothetical protein
MAKTHWALACLLLLVTAAAAKSIHRGPRLARYSGQS